MEMKPKSILEDINTKIGNREIFKYNRESLVQSLIVATNRAIFGAYFKMDLNYADQVVEQYRAILKFIYGVDNEDGIVPENQTPIIDEFEKLIDYFLKSYTPVRNLLDRCIIGTGKIKYDEANSRYCEYDCEEYSYYSRMIDKVKDFPSEKKKNEAFNLIGKYLNLKKFKTSVFKDRYFKSMIDDYREICLLDSEIKFDFDFGDFTYYELISFCASLKIIGDFYYFWLVKEGIFSIDYEDMVDGIYRLTNLPKSKIELFLKYQTYDYEYQKSKLTLIQGLILIADKFYFLPATINLGLLPVKMYRLIYDYDRHRYHKEILKIRKTKELQMTNDIVSTLKKYDLQIKTNHIIKNGKQPVAEYDMLVFDNQTTNLYICEFKWHFVGDGESDHKLIDDILEEEIQHRLEKDKYILDDSLKICEELFGSDKVNEVKELLISQNFSGNTKHSMPVIDFETLQWSTERFDCFEQLMDYFLTGEYRKAIPVQSELADIEVEGYKFSLYQICAKNN